MWFSKLFNSTKNKKINRHRTNPTWIYFINKCFSIFLILSLFHLPCLWVYFQAKMIHAKKEKKDEKAQGNEQRRCSSRNQFIRKLFCNLQPYCQGMRNFPINISTKHFWSLSKEEIAAKQFYRNLSRAISIQYKGFCENLALNEISWKSNKIRVKWGWHCFISWQADSECNMSH